MANSHKTLVSLFTDIANSIRSKTGKSGVIVADNFPSEIDAITVGGIYQEKTATPTGEQFDVLPDAGYDALSKVTVAGDSALKPWNIPEGTTIYGVVGTAKLAVTTDPPADLPVTKGDADTVLTENDATADTSTYDLMVLAQDDGNITYGYLSKGNGKASYNGVELPEFPDWDNTTYPYAHIVKEDNNYFFSVTSSPLVPINTSSFGTNNAVNFINFQYNTVGEKWEKVSESTGYINKSYKTLVWTNTDILKSDGTVYLAASAPVPSGAFTITSYDPITTEFKAKGWRRLSYHTTGEQAGTWTYDDFTDTESGGWNYLKNIRSCTREKLYWHGIEIWPQPFANATWETLIDNQQMSLTSPTNLANGVGYSGDSVRYTGYLSWNTPVILRLTVDGVSGIFATDHPSSATWIVGNNYLLDSTKYKDNGFDYAVLFMSGYAMPQARNSGVYSIKIEKVGVNS